MAWQLEVSNNANVNDTIKLILDTINVYGNSEYMRKLVRDLEPSSDGFDKRLFEFVCRNVQYERDPDGHEKVYTPARLLQEGKGDCKKMTTFIGAALKAAGIEPLIKVISYDGENYEHIYVVAKIGDRYVTLDPVADEKYDTEIDHKKYSLYNLAGDHMEKMKLSLLGNKPQRSVSGLDLSGILSGINSDLDAMANTTTRTMENKGRARDIYTPREWEEMFANLGIRDQFLPIYQKDIRPMQRKLIATVPKTLQLMSQLSGVGYYAPSQNTEVKAGGGKGDNNNPNVKPGEGKGGNTPKAGEGKGGDATLEYIMSHPKEQYDWWVNALNEIVNAVPNRAYFGPVDNPTYQEEGKKKIFQDSVDSFKTMVDSQGNYTWDEYTDASYNAAVVYGLDYTDLNYGNLEFVQTGTQAFDYDKQVHSNGDKILHTTAQAVMFPVRQAFLLLLEAGKLAKDVAGLNYAENLANAWNQGDNAKKICDIWYKFGGDWKALKKSIGNGVSGTIQLRGMGEPISTGAIAGAITVATPIIVALLDFMKKADPKHADTYEKAAKAVSNINTAAGGAPTTTDGTYTFNGTTCVATRGGEYKSSGECLLAHPDAPVDNGYHIDENGDLVPTSKKETAGSFFSKDYVNNIVKCILLIMLYTGLPVSFRHSFFIPGCCVIILYSLYKIVQSKINIQWQRKSN